MAASASKRDKEDNRRNKVKAQEEKEAAKRLKEETAKKKENEEAKKKENEDVDREKKREEKVAAENKRKEEEEANAMEVDKRRAPKLPTLITTLKLRRPAPMPTTSATKGPRGIRR